MKSNELRIGNIIKLSESNEIFMAYEICSSGFRVRNKNEDTWIEEWQFEGIGLTEEWLVKFGFELMISNKDSGYKQYGVNKYGFDIMFSIDCNCRPKCFVNNIGIEINYVHQLQNIYFLLTFEELALS